MEGFQIGEAQELLLETESKAAISNCATTGHCSEGEAPEYSMPEEISVMEKKSSSLRVSRQGRFGQRRFGNKPRKTEYKITYREYMEETSPEEREILRDGVNRAVYHFLSSTRPVYLDKLGLFLPILSTEHTSHQIESEQIIRKEHCIRVLFEKTSELTAFHKAQHPSVVEIEEIVDYLYARLPISVQARWDTKLTRRFVRGLFQSIRNEVIVDGFSGQLHQVGNLFALHNRQGENSDDWYAGADIILPSSMSYPIKAEICARFQQPILENAWEPLEAGLGPAHSTIKIDLAAELGQLGYDESLLRSQLSEEERTLRVAAFQHRYQKNKDVLIFCTDGLRHATGSMGSESSTPAHTENPIFGSELVVQLQVKDLFGGEGSLILPSELTSPARLLALAWVLLYSRRERDLQVGLGIAAEHPLFSHPNGKISGAFITPFQLIPSIQRCRSKTFRYMNVLGVTQDELRFSELHSATHFMEILQYKSMDQVTSPHRKSIFTKSRISSEEPSIFRNEESYSRYV